MDLIKKGSLLSTASLFLIRRRVLEFLNKLEKSKTLTCDDIEDIAEKLIEYEHHAIPVIMKNFIQLKDPLIINRYEYLIMNIYDTEFLKYLANINLEENLYLRNSVINLLNFYGQNLREIEIYPFIEEYFHEAVNQLDLTLKTKENLHLFAFNLIKMFYFLTDFEKESLIERINPSDNENIYTLCYLFLWTGSNSIITETIKLLSRIKTEKSLYLLKIAKIFLPERFAHEIDRSIKKLNFSGIDKEEPPDFFKKNYNIVTKISNLNKDNGFFLFFEVKDFNALNKFLLSVSDFYLLSVNSYLYGKSDSSLESVFQLKEAKSSFVFAILKDIIRNHHEMEIPFPWHFTYLCFFLNYKDLIPQEYECQIKEKGDIFFNQYTHNQLTNLLGDNDWLLNDIRFIEIIEKWYLNTEPYEDLWRDHLFIRKIIREIILPEFNHWKRRLCQLADYLYLVESKQKLSMIIHKTIDRLTPDIEIIEKEDLIKEIILYNKEKFLKTKRR